MQPRFRPAGRRIAWISSVAFAAAVLAVLAATPLAAARSEMTAEAFVDSIGINVHVTYLRTPYRRIGAVRDALARLGVRHVRDVVTVDGRGRPARGWRRGVAVLGRAGVRFTLIAGLPGGAWGDLDGILHAIRTHRRSVDAVEGPNEYDVFGARAWAPRLIAWQDRLSARLERDPALRGLQLVAPSLANRSLWSSVALAGLPYDVPNLHAYSLAGPPESTLRAALGDLPQPLRAPPMVTEAGWHNAIGAREGVTPVDEATAAVYVPRLFLEAARLGVRRTFLYELLDENAHGGASDPEDNFGLLRKDFSAKPAFWALANLIAAVSSRGSPGPGAVSPQVVGLPPDGRQLVLRLSDGEVLIALWRDVAVWDGFARQPVGVADAPVTLVLPCALTVATYRPSIVPGRVSTRRLAALTVGLGADVQLFRLSGRCDQVRLPAPAAMSLDRTSGL